MPSVLFIHNGPASRFGFVARALVQRGWRAALINDDKGADLPGAQTIRWKLDRGETKDIFPPAIRAELDLLRGRAAAECALKLKADGFDPELIIGHPGWGEMLFLREVFPHARQIQIGEFYYRSQRCGCRVRSRIRIDQFRVSGEGARENAGTRDVLCGRRPDRRADAVPGDLLPPVFHQRVAVIHEGIDTAWPSLGRRRRSAWRRSCARPRVRRW